MELLNGFDALVEIGAGSCLRLKSYWMWVKVNEVTAKLQTFFGVLMGTGSPYQEGDMGDWIRVAPYP